MTTAEQFALKAAQNNNRRVRADILEKYGNVGHNNSDARQKEIIERLFKENQRLGHV